MDTNLLFGAFSLAFGLLALVMRFVAPTKFRKLPAMQKAYGKRAGTAIHVIGYTVVPLVAGAFFLYASFAE